MHDPLAAALVVRTDLAESANLHVDVETHGRLAAGATLARTPSDDAPANARVALGINVADAERFIAARLAPPLNGRVLSTDAASALIEGGRTGG